MDAHGLPNTPTEVVKRASDLIDRYGFDSRGFGDHHTGFSLEGAIYDALGLVDTFYHLRDLYDLTDNGKFLYDLADTVFVLLAAAMGKISVRKGRAHLAVIEGSRVLGELPGGRRGAGKTEALSLLATVAAELAEEQTPAAA
jgi:hypothetical protein